ncbi:mannose-6-phosphate isomerase [Klebsiella pneumoniae]|nr:mannose-6-phosphate isomerase [Klebsiella pneumoniae]
MQSWSSKDFTADRAWGALDIANFSGTTVRLHWTDQPYIWHINDGQEVFAVMDGQVAMHVKVDGEEQVIMLNAGDIFYADFDAPVVNAGEAHTAQQFAGQVDGRLAHGNSGRIINN